MNYNNHRILMLSSGENFNVMKKLSTYGNKHWNWKIKVVASSEYMKPYSEFIDSKSQVIVVPEFLKKQKWEDDPEELKKIRDIMRKCEKNMRIPLSRIFLSDERLLGRAYSKSCYSWPGGKLTRQVLSNNNISDLVMTRIFKFANDALNEMNPTLCFGFAPGTLTSTVFYYLLQHYRIPNVSCMFSPLIPHSHYWSSTWRIENDELSGNYLQRVASGMKAETPSFEYIEKFRKTPEPLPIYDGMWARASKSTGLRNINKWIAKLLLARVLEIIRKVKVPNPHSLWQLYINSCRIGLMMRLKKSYYESYSEKALSEFKYIYYPCHQDPELVLNVRAPFWHNQRNTIKMLSYNLPVGYKLLVREHCNNVGRRSAKYIKEIKSYPGVELVDAFDSQYKYIKNADLVVTVNGMSGFEGILLKRPVMTLDKTFYDVLGYAHSYESSTDLGEAILNCIDEHHIPDDYDDKIALLLDAEKSLILHDEDDPDPEMACIRKLIEKHYSVEVSTTL